MYSSGSHLPEKAGLKARIPTISALLEKGSGTINEDDLLLGNRNFGVFDGATSLVPTSYSCGRTGGRIAAEICKQVFKEENHSLVAAAENANREIRRQSLAAGIDFGRKEEMWSCSAAVVRLHYDYFEWAQLGDCCLLVVREDGSSQLLGHIPKQDTETLKQWQRRGGLVNGSVMEVMAEEIRAVRKRMNIDYGVFNGEPEGLDFLANGRMDLNGIRTLLLFSDGLQLPQKDPAAQQDLDRFVSLYCQGGLQALRDQVRSRQLEDICCIQYPRFKLHDDISTIAINFDLS